MKKLFYEDTHIIDFTAVITDCFADEHRRGIWLVLDQTAFFPEEGGQKADKGTIEDQEVLDVQIKEDIIYHLVHDLASDADKGPAFSIGQRITGHVDWSQRFDFMQQHSGEHILSGLLHKHFGFKNVGFHLGAEEVTMDFDRPISLDMLRPIEQEANEIIWANLPVKAYFPAPEVLEQLNYRSKIDIAGDVRIVEIPGVDMCACCAPHVDHTGQIGMIKILSAQNHRGGVRIQILCGARALKDYTFRQDTCSAITGLLSAKPEKLVSAVERLMAESLDRKQKINLLAEQLLHFTIAALPAPDAVPDPILFIDLDNPVAIRNAVNTLTEKYPGYVSFFAGNDETGYSFIIGSRTRDCREIAATLRTGLGAKGGGSAQMVQGNVNAFAKDIRNTLKSLCSFCK